MINCARWRHNLFIRNPYDYGHKELKRGLKEEQRSKEELKIRLNTEEHRAKKKEIQ